MKKACSYCGKVHKKGYLCDKKPMNKYFSGYNVRSADKFRSSYDWKMKREHILKRDKYLCVACLNGVEGSEKKYCTDNLSVHHIRPLETDYELRLSDNNLITLCEKHHEMAEKGDISAEKLMKMIENIPPEG